MLGWLFRQKDAVPVTPSSDTTPQPPLGDVSLSSEEVKTLTRSLRKLTTALEEQSSVASALDGRIDDLKAISNLQESAWFPILDRLYELFGALRSEKSRWADELLRQIGALERLARMVPLAKPQGEIDPTECQVVSTIEAPPHLHGTVYGIVRQGYRRLDGSLVRESVVILARAPNLRREESYLSDEEYAQGSEEEDSEDTADPNDRNNEFKRDELV